MRHLKRYNHINESLDYSQVDVWDDYSTEEDKDMMVSGLVSQVERATKEDVVDVSGRAGSDDFSLEMELRNGDLVDLYYTYAPYHNRERRSGYVIIEYTRGEDTWKKTELDIDTSNVDAGEDVLAIIKEILAESVPTYVLELPREHFGTSGYHYDVDNETKAYMMINVEFSSEKEAEAWIDSLYDHIKKKPRS
jgi:hypothetical protein